jgi:hypothetical protein
LKIQYFSGVFVSVTSAQYQSIFIKLPKSFFSKIESQLIKIKSSSNLIHLIAAPVHFSSP